MLNKQFIKFFLFLVVAVFARTPGLAAYSYGPACQWIHLEGRVEVPSNSLAKPPYILTVNYQLPNMKNPATLLTSQRLNRSDFVFYFSGFKETIANVHLVSPMFFFAKEIIFRYSVRTLDGHYRSPTYKTIWTPTPVPIVDTPNTRKKQYRCHTKVVLESMILEKDRWFGRP